MAEYGHGEGKVPTQRYKNQQKYNCNEQNDSGLGKKTLQDIHFYYAVINIFDSTIILNSRTELT